MIYSRTPRTPKPSEAKLQNPEIISVTIKSANQREKKFDQSKEIEDKSIIKYRNAWKEYLNELLNKSQENPISYRQDSRKKNTRKARYMQDQETFYEEINDKTINEDIASLYKQSFMSNFKDESTQIDTPINSQKIDLSPKIWRNKQMLSPIDFYKILNGKPTEKSLKPLSPVCPKIKSPHSDLEDSYESKALEKFHSKSVKSVPKHISLENYSFKDKESFLELTPNLHYKKKPDLYENHRRRLKILKMKESTERGRGSCSLKTDVNGFIEIKSKKQLCDANKKIKQIKGVKLPKLKLS
ncbi:unnamed protein product [Blepharisma stoltei]|uniref:Uncharacterized protein n=1 Tax=Blepharisma stoltei TaxID=1481888 RepID=A0AAU9JMN7_9CILI|nr:unnamed protein product [Blepharisma stoltei]